ncbi:kinase-like domain-containing protein [Phakopsora pachyrhizi]|uniref:Kinase-like domain-containing protein n=1 Tax=Phakopsora pachyrhizi TaxID=170000 RepID=A0AAV0BSV2_PHAPC|nr:kinase-like domain-containing protein [Phakopsora pachyrhizi]
MVQGSDPQRPDTSNRAQEDVNAEDEKRQQGSTKKDEIGELLDLESLNLQDKEIQSDQLKKFELIGSGGFKDVYRGVYRKVPVAIADIRGHLTEMDIKELKILRDLRHENIVRFIGVSVPEESLKRTVPIMIVSELCTNGDLFDYIRKVPNPGFLKICGIFRDICKGLDYLHSNVPVIIHRDLKSSNVLITSRGVAKLNDFGLARIKNSTRSMVKSLVGTVNWQAPELWVAHPRYNEKVDVYSAGLVLWEMLQWHQITKRYPFEGQNEHAIYQEVGQRQIRPATAGMRRQWGDELLNFIERLWNQNPSERPTMRESIREIDRIAQQFKANNK